MERETADLPSGQIHYLKGGSGDPLILLHSVGWSSREFDWVADELSRHYQVIAWDMPGHGDSAPLGEGATLEDYADSIAALMDALGIKRAHLLGVSIGGLLGVAFHERHAHRLHTLAIVEAGFQDDAAWQAAWPMVEASFSAAILPREAVAPRFRALNDMIFDRWNTDRERVGGAAMVAAMWALRRYRYEGPLDRLDVPVLLLYGDKSPVATCLPMLREILPAADVFMLENCGHFPMIDDPAAFNAAVLGFLRRY